MLGGCGDRIELAKVEQVVGYRRQRGIAAYAPAAVHVHQFARLERPP